MDLSKVGLKGPVGYAVLAAVILGSGAWLWLRSDGAFSAQAAEGFHVVCSDPGCSAHFVIPRDQAKTYPRGPNGEGFKCEKCGKFSANIGAQCPQCGNWYLRQNARGAEGGCPHCAKQGRSPG